MSDNRAFKDYEEPADAVDEFTVVHVDDEYDFFGARHYGQHMGDCPPVSKGWLGNPFKVKTFGREECIEMFRDAYYDRLRDEHKFCLAILAIDGNRVACHCRHEDDELPACHLDVVKDSLDSGHVHRIAHTIHNITLSDEENQQMCDPSELL